MYQFIVNPGAGAGRGYRIWKRLEHQLEMNSREYRVFFTEHQGDAAEIARVLTAEKDEAKVIVIVGGEGTYNEVLNGVSFRGLLTFGYVPAGFRNALSKGFQSFWKVDRQARRILHPKYYRMLDYGVITFGNEEIVSRRFAGRCGIGLDAALCHNLLCCPVRNQMTRLHLTKILRFGIGLKQLFLAKPTKGYILLDGTQKVEFNHIYFITFMVRREEKKKKNGGILNDDGKMTVYVGNSARKTKMIPILRDLVMGVRRKERGIRVFECSEAEIHLARPLAVHVDGESCMCQENLAVRCIPNGADAAGSGSAAHNGEMQLGGDSMRIGQGYDVHRLVEGRKLIIGGVDIPYEKGLLGHSDADVLLHAVMDALLGAAALGDIGQHFPDSDERYKGISSIALLKEVGKILQENGYMIENIDSTVIAQRPKLLPYRPQMAENIAAALGIEKEQVSVKATTEEGLGFTGTGEGISAQAIALLSSVADYAPEDRVGIISGGCGGCPGCRQQQ